MRRCLTVCGLLIGLTMAHASSLRRSTDSLPPKSGTDDAAAVRAQSSYQRRDTWYEFVLKQFNPDNVDYGNWIEQQRNNFIELRLKNQYFVYSVCITIALILVAAICLKQRVDHQRVMSITAEMMADLYNQDAYSRHAAQEAIERYNRHIERCNRAIEADDVTSGVAARGELEQLRTELMRVAEERDSAIRDRDIAREDLRRKSEILADMSVRFDAATNKSTMQGSAKPASDARAGDTRLVSHINHLQEQLYVERANNRRLKGG